MEIEFVWLDKWWNRLDDRWKEVFRQAINIDGEPTESELDSIFSLQKLDCSYSEIRNLKPLRALTKLQELNCSENQISDLEPLWALTKLQKLECNGNKISDLEPLRILSNLQHLDCNWNKITDLEPLRALTNLQYLDCSSNQISQAEIDNFEEAIPNCKFYSSFMSRGEQWVQIWKENFYKIALGFSDYIRSWFYWAIFSFAGYMHLWPLLQSLDLVDDPDRINKRKWWNRLDEKWKKVFSQVFYDEEPTDDDLEMRVFRLDKLDCSNNQISDLKPLRPLIFLEHLDCSNNRISNLRPLYGLTKLEVLECGDNPISKAELDNFKGNVPECKVYISSPAPLLQSSELIAEPKSVASHPVQADKRKWWDQLGYNWKSIFEETVEIKGEPTDNDLGNIFNLRELNCSERLISNLEPLRALTMLRELNCNYNEIGDLEPLRVLTNLRYLDCGYNKISNLEPLRALSNLQELHCQRNQISNLEPLQALTNLQSLSCKDNPISSADIGRFETAMHGCRVHW